MDQAGNSQKDQLDPEAMVEDFSQRHNVNHILMEYGPQEREWARRALLIAFGSKQRKGDEPREREPAADGTAQGSDTRPPGEAVSSEGPKGKVNGGGALGDARTYLVTMADGTRLATDVFFPEGKGPWPVVLTRTPYNKSLVEYLPFIRSGYAAVNQDIRGRFASEGKNIPFIGCGWEGHGDGLETVQWIREQPWCSGTVFTHGGSANAITQNLLAGSGGVGLDGQYILSAAASIYHDAAYIGGAFHLNRICVWMREVGFYPEALGDFRNHPAYDEYWKKYDTTIRFRYMDAPAMHVGGWFDIFCQGTIDAFLGRQRKGGSSQDKQVLVMGPWSHGTFQQNQVGELFFPYASLPEGYSDMEWFQRCLDGDFKETVKPVAYYVMGDVAVADTSGNEWRFAENWPPPAEETSFYLDEDGLLSVESPGSSSAKRSFTFDPTDPCLTLGGANLALPSGPMDQSLLEARDDVLVFTTVPLDDPIEVTGRIKAKIFASSSAVDTDISVRLCDVYPDGTSYLLAEGVRRLRFRESFQQPVPLDSSEVYEIEVDCWSTSIIFDRGHRIRVSVTSSNFPRFDPNPGTGEPWSAGCRYEIQHNIIHCSRQHPSCIVLPLVGD